MTAQRHEVKAAMFQLGRKETCEWISRLLDGSEPLREDTLFDELANGLKLLDVAETLAPIGTPSLPRHRNAKSGSYWALDNLAHFLKWARSLGCAKHELFTPQMLSQPNDRARPANQARVIASIVAISRRAFELYGIEPLVLAGVRIPSGGPTPRGKTHRAGLGNFSGSDSDTGESESDDGGDRRLLRGSIGFISAADVDALGVGDDGASSSSSSSSSGSDGDDGAQREERSSFGIHGFAALERKKSMMPPTRGFGAAAPIAIVAGLSVSASSTALVAAPSLAIPIPMPRQSLIGASALSGGGGGGVVAALSAAGVGVRPISSGLGPVSLLDSRGDPRADSPELALLASALSGGGGGGGDRKSKVVSRALERSAERTRSLRWQRSNSPPRSEAPFQLAPRVSDPWASVAVPTESGSVGRGAHLRPRSTSLVPFPPVTQLSSEEEEEEDDLEGFDDEFDELGYNNALLAKEKELGRQYSRHLLRASPPLVREMVATHPYAAAHPDELSLARGECVKILDTGVVEEEGWCRCTSMETGRVGFVPRNFLAPREAIEFAAPPRLPPQPPSVPSATREVALRALFDFGAIPRTPEEVEIRGGEIVAGLRIDGPWYHVRTPRGEMGVVPTTYVEEIRPEEEEEEEEDVARAEEELQRYAPHAALGMGRSDLAPPLALAPPAQAPASALLRGGRGGRRRKARPTSWNLNDVLVGSTSPSRASTEELVAVVAFLRKLVKDPIRRKALDLDTIIRRVERGMGMIYGSSSKWREWIGMTVTQLRDEALRSQGEVEAEPTPFPAFVARKKDTVGRRVQRFFEKNSLQGFVNCSSGERNKTFWFWGKLCTLKLADPSGGTLLIRVGGGFERLGDYCARRMNLYSDAVKRFALYQNDLIEALDGA